MQQWKIGQRVATAARLHAVFVICNFTGDKAVVRASGEKPRVVAIRNLRRCLTAIARQRLEARAAVERKSVDELQRFYQTVFGDGEQRLRERLFRKEPQRTGKPRGRPRKADTPERIRDRERYWLRGCNRGISGV